MYKRFYLLNKMPFENSSNPEFLYLSRQHKEAMTALISGIRSRKELILITGDAGTGKTTLIRALARELKSSAFIVHINNPQPGFEGIAYHLAQELSIHFIEKLTHSELYDKIKFRLGQACRGGISTVLIIDEAHLLERNCLEQLQALFHHVNRDHQIIQIVMAGQRGICNTIQRAALAPFKEKIAVDCSLEVMERDDVGKYIAHRLYIAGKPDPLFDRKARLLIWKNSGGIPQVINQICDTALVVGCLLGSRKINSRIVEKALDDIQTGFKPD